MPVHTYMCVSIHDYTYMYDVNTYMYIQHILFTPPGPRATPPGPGRLRASGSRGAFRRGPSKAPPPFFSHTSYTYLVNIPLIRVPRTHTTYTHYQSTLTYTYHIPRTHTTYHVQAHSYRMTIQTMTLQSLNQHVTRLNHSKGLGLARGTVPGARARSYNEDPRGSFVLCSHVSSARA